MCLIVNHSVKSHSSSCCKCTGKWKRLRATNALFNRKDNAVVLSETMDENSIQTLLDLFIADKHPKQCEEWYAAKKNISDFYAGERTKREHDAFEELVSKEQGIQRVIRDAVVEDVMVLFPCVLFESVLSYEVLRYSIFFRSLERDRLIPSHTWQSREDETTCKNSCLRAPSVPVGCSLYLAGSTQFSDLKESYPEFQEIYRSQFQRARFDTTLRRDEDFGALKLRLVAVQHLLGKHQRLRRNKRAKLVQTLLRGDFNRAQRILEESRRSSVVKLVASAIGACPPQTSNDETLKGEMKSISARLSDSQFLLNLKDVNDELLRPMIQEIEGLSHYLLSPLIDTTVGSMADAVMALQKDVVRRNIQHDIESDEMKRQNEKIAVFVRELNAQSAWRKDRYVLSDFIEYE